MSHNSEENRLIAGKYLTEPAIAIRDFGVDKVVDAFTANKLPVPRSLCDELAKQMQNKLPPGYTAIVEPYLNRWRALVVKSDKVAFWGSLPDAERE